MARQAAHSSGRVVSVRLPDEVIERLDALTAHTGRSRGVYLRLAVTAMLPLLEADHWAQTIANYEQNTLEREFVLITSMLMAEDATGGAATDSAGPPA